MQLWNLDDLVSFGDKIIQLLYLQPAHVQLLLKILYHFYFSPQKVKVFFSTCMLAIFSCVAKFWAASVSSCLFWGGRIWSGRGRGGDQSVLKFTSNNFSQFQQQLGFSDFTICPFSNSIFNSIFKCREPAHFQLQPSASLLPARPPLSPSVDIVLVVRVKMNTNIGHDPKCIVRTTMTKNITFVIFWRTFTSMRKRPS